MFVILAVVLMIMPLAVVMICEQAAKRGRGPLARPDRLIVFDATVVPTPVREKPADRPPAGPVFTDPRDADRCDAESRLVRELLQGKLDRSRYHAEMAALAANAVSPPVRLPGEPDESRG